ncbi:MAG TPA: methyltransferase domain-containing protein [Abditibacteriaceae bacterium]|jgi:SAM-dependent methyltransferase
MFSSSQIEAHRAFLYRNIFQTETKWPHFRRLLEDVQDLADTTREDETALCLERAYVYGGDSLFAPLFKKGRFVAVDCETETAKERGGYQKSWTEHPDCLHVPCDRIAPITDTGLESECADVVMVPNVVHHVRDQDAMFAEIARLLKPGGRGYIFEALLRELHQSPDDYIRWTPWGFETQLKKHGLKLTEWKAGGGPFEAVAYCWIQALQYLPADERKEKERWFFEEEFPRLMEMDARVDKNLVRPLSSFPLAYGIFFSK